MLKSGNTMNLYLQKKQQLLLKLNLFWLLFFIVFTFKTKAQEVAYTQDYSPNENNWVESFNFTTSLNSNTSTLQYSVVALTGFNADIIAEGNQIPSSTTTHSVDDSYFGDYVFYNQTYSYNSASPSLYLPSNGAFTSERTPGLPYQLAPANGNNSLRLTPEQLGTLTFTTPVSAKKVYVLATSGESSSNVEATVNFDDGTKEYFYLLISDWFDAPYYAIRGVGRVKRDGSDLESLSANNPRLYEYVLTINTSNHEKNIVSITFENNYFSDGIAHIMGISIENEVISPCFSPTALTASNLTIESTTIGWTSTGSLFDIEWGVAGFAQGTGTIINEIEQTTYSISNLTANTQYDFYVRTNCEINQSEWTEPFSFTTLKNCSTGNITLASQQQVNDFGINYAHCENITIDNLYIGHSSDSTNINDLSPLQNITSITGNLTVRNTYINNINGLSSLTNTNGFIFFRTNNLLTNLNGLSNLESINGYIEVRENAILEDISGLQNINPETITTTYGIEIVNNPNLSVCNLSNFCIYLQSSGNRSISGNANSCLNNETLILSCNSCEIPTALNVENLHINTVNLVWESEGDFFDLEWGIAGFIQGSGTIINNIEESIYSLSNLQVDTEYEFYIRQNCGTIQSNWSDPFSFRTLKSCSTGDIILANQQQVDEFGVNYSHCQEIVISNLYIGNDYNSPSNTNSLSPLQNVIEVTGNLNIEYNSILTLLEGLNSITTIGGNLWINLNNNLQNFEGLSSLQNISGNLYVINNTQIINSHGFDSLISIGGRFHFYNNNNLTSLESFSNLQTIGNRIYIERNNSLENLHGLELIESVVSLEIYYNNNLQTLEGLNSLSTITSELRISNNNVLQNIDAINSLETIGSNIIVYGNPNLENIDALSQVQSTNGRIEILSNNSLVNLNGLNGLNSIGGYINIESNQILNDISGLQNIDPSSITNLSITYNPNLSICNASNLCIYLSNPSNTHPRNISNNSIECTSVTAIINASCQNSCTKPANLSVQNLHQHSGDLIWESEEGLFDIEWGITGFEQGNGILAEEVQTTSYTLSNLVANTQYEFYVRRDCEGNKSEWAGPFSFTTSCMTVTVPYLLDFESAITPALPECTSIQNLGNGNNWNTTTTTNYGFSGKVLRYTYNFSNAANVWFFTHGVELEQGVTYVISYDYATSSTHSVEKLKVAYGTENINTAMLHVLADHPNISHNMKQTNEVVFTPSSSGVYYFGFHAYSAANQYTLYVDNISINVKKRWTGAVSTAWENPDNWIGGVPSTSDDVVVDSENPAIINSDVEIASLTVSSGSSVTVNGLLTTGNITVENGGSLTIANEANLLQSGNAVNTGAISVRRNTLIKHLDYTIWSSPVIAQGLQAFSPLTLANRIRIYNAQPSVNNWVVTTGNFVSGKGYMFRAPNANDGSYAGTYTWTGTFAGTPENGNVTAEFNTLGTFQSIGNPYPSNIDRVAFHNTNPDIGTLYFWTNVNSPVNGIYTANNWATVNRTGEMVAAIASQNEEQNSAIPSGIISVGQGFVAETNGVIQQAVFNNTMRTSNSAVFFRTIPSEKHRLWLDLSSENQNLNQILVGYIEEATNDEDFGIDSKLFGYSGSALYSLIDASENQFIIQGRALPFDDMDIVPLGFRAVNDGSYTISLSNFDGLFTEGQDIYLKDTFTQTTQNLKDGSYSFVSETGTFNNRFEVVYREGSMSVSNPDLNNNWIVYKQDNTFHIQTQGFEMSEVTVYDMLGRTVYISKATGNSHIISQIEANQVLIVKVITIENEVLNRKVSY